ncbi:MAG: peptidoglycan-binding protein [Nitrospirae bacterium]|nr:peptidoglycan-binding protein [Nitrospirota bacterium]
MADFRPAVEKILAYEGGYVNDPDDYGGETNMGISRRAYPNLDIKALDKETVVGIYYRDYWCRFQGDKIASQAVAMELLDSAVNMGWCRSVKFFQEALNLLTGATLLIDGLVGPKTIDKANAYKYPGALVKVLNGLQFARYREIIEDNPLQRKFFRSWLARVEFKS